MTPDLLPVRMLSKSLCHCGISPHHITISCKCINSVFFSSIDLFVFLSFVRVHFRFMSSCLCYFVVKAYHRVTTHGSLVSSAIWVFLFHIPNISSQSQGHIATDGQSISKSWPDFYYCLTVTVLFLWGALFDGRTGLFFYICCCSSPA
jgi:hypothetical protein